MTSSIRRDHARIAPSVPSAGWFIDLDDVKRVNDPHGHHVGDELLVAVARRLETLVRSDDTHAPLSGYEFVFLCENLVARSDAELLVRRIGAAFHAPFELSDVDVTLAASVGMAVPGPGETISERLLVAADTAMYQAKTDGPQSTQLPGRHDLPELDRSVPSGHSHHDR